MVLTASARRIGLLVFILNLMQLIVAQILIRKMGLEFPMDLTSFALTLIIQFLTMCIATVLSLFFPDSGKNPAVLASVMAAKGISVWVASSFSNTAIPVAVSFFFLTGVETTLLFTLFRREAPSSGLAGLNSAVYAASAMGLLLAEKIIFPRVPFSTVLQMLALLQLCVAAVWLVISRRSYNQQPVLSPAGLAGFSAAAIAFLSGFMLFAGVMLAYRFLRFYLRDAADITAEVTAISMLLGALVSLNFARIRNAGYYSRMIFPASFLLFIGIVQNLHRLLLVPREVLIALLLAGVSAPCAYLYNSALDRGKNSAALTVLLAINVAGCFTGAFCFGYLLIPQYGLLLSFHCYVFLGSALYLLWIWQGEKRKLSLAVATALFCAMVLTLSLQKAWFVNQLETLANRIAPGENIISSVETPQDVWLLTRRQLLGQPLHHRLIQNAHSMSGTQFANRRYMKLMAYLGQLYALEKNTALNIGYGTGLTAQALLEDAQLRNLDVVDVSPQLTELAGHIYQSEQSPDPVRDPRFAYHTGGIRNFLRSSPRQFDIITGEPPPPSNSSIAYLYTREYYASVAAHLRPGGVFTYWLPTHSVSDRSAAAIWATFRSVFPYADLFAGTETNLIMVGWLDQPSRKISLEQRGRQIAGAQLRRETNLQSLPEIFSLLIATTASPPRKDDSIRMVTDDFPYIEEGYPALSRTPWGLGGASPDYASALGRRFSAFEAWLAKISPFLIYSADAAGNPYIALSVLEKILPERPHVSVILWMLGIDYRAEMILKSASLPADHPQRITLAFAEKLEKQDGSGALKYLDSLGNALLQDERLYAYRILSQRMHGVPNSVIRREALAYAHAKGRVSLMFRDFAEQNIKADLPAGRR